MHLLRLPRALRGIGRRVARHLRPRRIGPRVARRVRDNVADGDSERLVHTVRDLVSRDELPAGRMPRDHDRPHVRKDVLVRQLLQDLIDEIERGQLRVADRVAAGTPTIAGAAPAHLVRGERIVAAPGRRGDSRRDDDRVVERSCEKGR